MKVGLNKIQRKEHIIERIKVANYIISTTFNFFLANVDFTNERRI